jgi:hypothetical protein
MSELMDELVRLVATGIIPDRVYPPDEAASLIGFRGVRAGKSIREIPCALLPLIPITPGGRIVGYLGRDLIRYVEERRATVTREKQKAG